MNFKDFDAKFPDDAACLEFIFKARYANHVCECGKSGCFHRRKKRRAYQCAFCGAQIYPTADTIFHKSETSLKSWFFAIFLFAKSKNGVAAKELERQLGVTYKTAHRMGHKIRALMAGGGDLLSGVVEADETYIGGVSEGKRGRGALGKTAVIGIAERRGGVVAKVMDRVTTDNAIKLIRQNVKAGTTVHTDEFPIYNYVGKLGFTHEVVNHGPIWFRLYFNRSGFHFSTLPDSRFFSKPQPIARTLPIKSRHNGFPPPKSPIHSPAQSLRPRRVYLFHQRNRTHIIPGLGNE